MSKSSHNKFHDIERIIKQYSNNQANLLINLFESLVEANIDLKNNFHNKKLTHEDSTNININTSYNKPKNLNLEEHFNPSGNYLMNKDVNNSKNNVDKCYCNCCLAREQNSKKENNSEVFVNSNNRESNTTQKKNNTNNFLVDLFQNKVTSAYISKFNLDNSYSSFRRKQRKGSNSQRNTIFSNNVHPPRYIRTI